MKMLLLDVGNTRVKWAVITHETWLAEGAAEHRAFAALLDGILDQHADIRRVSGCNVAANEHTRAIDARLAKARLRTEWLRAQPYAAGVRNHYTRPEQLGPDRWAALVAARNLHRGTCLVICAGTATTIDILDRAGNFRGGMILPGLQLMQHALARDTARLELGAGRYTDYPRNTADAIYSGCLVAQAGAIEHAYRQLGDPQAACLIGGGAGAEVESALKISCRRVDNLVLRGLAVLAESACRANRETPDC